MVISPSMDSHFLELLGAVLETYHEVYTVYCGGRIRSRMFIETIAGTTIHTIENTSNEEDPHVYNHISNPSYNQLYKYMAI